MIPVRQVAPGDRAEWLRMREALWPGEGDLAPDVDAFLAGRPTTPPSLVAVFVATDAAGCPAGFLELAVREYAEGCEGRTPYVEGWYVDGPARRRGVGHALLAAAEGWAREHGYRALASDIESENEVSERAHLAFGFEEVERLTVFRKAL